MFVLTQFASALSRVKHFLPSMQSANEEMERKIKEGSGQDLLMELEDPDAPGLNLVRSHVRLGIWC